jgi:pyruvate/2-oxoglutarate dehydrogenase complex dihydrolipoamide dehydrogenase (E3) component
LGAEVTVLEMATLMPRDDQELVDVLRTRLKADGIDIREGVEVVGVGQEGGDVLATLRDDGGETRVEGTHILVAAGRRPTVEGLDLETAGIEFSATGIKVDARLRTTNKRVFAIGDVAGGHQFTHAANYHAGIVIRNALFRLPAKVDTNALPWVTYTMPELAQVGLIESQAKRQAGDIRLLRWPFAENDRARTEADTDGLIKVVTAPRGRILGAGIVGPRAGELIHTWVLAVSRKMKIGAIANMIAPYPTFGEVSKRAAGSFYTSALFGEGTKKIIRLLARLG